MYAKKQEHGKKDLDMHKTKLKSVILFYKLLLNRILNFGVMSMCASMWSPLSPRVLQAEFCREESHSSIYFLLSTKKNKKRDTLKLRC